MQGMTDRRDFNGRWALVTGASAGIGVAFARELARRGANLILTARRADRLETLATELRATGTEVRIVFADLNEAASPRAIYDATEGAGLHVDVLVNNAGLGQYGPFHQSPIEQELSQIRVNCEAMVHLTRLFAPRMVERRQGWILILSSVASFQPLPNFATYAATKAFDRFFALGLAAEVSRHGVKVTALCPGPTESEFFEIARAGAVSGNHRQSAVEVVNKGLDALLGGRRSVIPYFGGKAIAFASWLFPTRMITYFVEKETRTK